MAYDPILADRVRRALVGSGDVIEKRMFGGLCFMLNGHMCCGVEGANLVLRVGAAHYEEALARTHVRPMDFTGRALRGFVYVSPAGLSTARALQQWVDLASANVAILPRRIPRAPGARRKRV